MEKVSGKKVTAKAVYSFISFRLKTRKKKGLKFIYRVSCSQQFAFIFYLTLIANQYDNM